MTQAILFHTLAVHAVTAGRLGAAGPWHVLAVGVPNPAPSAPPNLTQYTDVILGWGKWSVLVCGVAGVLISGGKMALGHLTRSSNLAADAATHLPVIFLGLSLVAISAGLVGAFL